MFEKNNPSMIGSPNAVDQLIKFEHYFPKCSQAVDNYEEIMKEPDWGNLDPREFYPKIVKHLFPLFDDELNKAIPFGAWETLKSYNWSTIAVHTINVLFRTINNSIYQNQCNDSE